MKDKIVIYGLTGLTAIIGIIMIIFYSQEHMSSEFAGLGVLFWFAGWIIYLVLFLIIAFIVKLASGNSAGMKAWLWSLAIFIISFVLSGVVSKIHMKNYEKQRQAEYKFQNISNNNVREAFKTDSLNPVLLYKMAKLEGCYKDLCGESILYLRKAIEIDSTYLKAYQKLQYNLRVDGQIEEANKLEAKIKELKSAESSDIFRDERDNHLYKTIKIGSQTWMAENLAFKTNKGCRTYYNDPDNQYEFGYLYDWETAKKVCPKGWHLPTKTEIETLLDNFGGKNNFNEENYNALIRGGKSGFSATLGGCYEKDINKFLYLGNNAFFWSASKDNDGKAYSLNIGSVKSKHAGIGKNITSEAYSVRCIKDN